MKKTIPSILLIGLAISTLAIISSETTFSADNAEKAKPKKPAPQFTVAPVGKIVYRGEKRFIVLDKKYEKGLLGLDKFSHINVFWWFDKNDTPRGRSVLQVHPRGKRSNPLTGVFATRSPFRPNLIALTNCKIVAVRGNEIEIEKTDAFDGTPVLDIKPFIPGYDTPKQGAATVPKWTK